MQKKIVYVPIESDSPTIIIKQKFGNIGAIKEEAYVLTEDELRELLGDAFDAGVEFGNPYIEGNVDNKEEHINSVVK